MISRWAICALVLALAGCASSPPLKVVASKPITITVTKYIPIPPDLLVPCMTPIADADALDTNGTLLAAWQHDGNGLRLCAAQVDAIRALQQVAHP